MMVVPYSAASSSKEDDVCRVSSVGPVRAMRSLLPDPVAEFE